MRKHLTYGLNQNKELVYISDCKNGLACNLVAPCCGKKLIAKNKGRQVAHHFAHYSGDECNNALESQAHLLAKKITTDLKKIKLPVFKEGYFIRDKWDYFEVESAKKEYTLKTKRGDLIADAALIANGKTYFLEFWVTHAVDEVKMNKIKSTEHIFIEYSINKNNTLSEIKDIIKNGIHFRIISSKSTFYKSLPSEVRKQQKIQKINHIEEFRKRFPPPWDKSTRIQPEPSIGPLFDVLPS